MNDELTIIQKCVVDADNIFVLGRLKFKIDDNNNDYKVYNSYKTNPIDYTNASCMTHVYACVNTHTTQIVFLNEKFKQIKKVYIYE